MSCFNKPKQAKFNIGEIVIHKNQKYTAIIIDIDPVFQASKVYNPLVNKYSFATENLWYRLLVNNSCQETYVRESLLIKNHTKESVNNPNVFEYLEIKDGVYYTRENHH